MNRPLCFGLFLVASLSLAACTTSSGNEGAGAKVETDMRSTSGGLPLNLDTQGVNQSKDAGGFAVTSLGGQVYLPKQALTGLKDRVPLAEKSLTSEPGNLPALKVLAYNSLVAGNVEMAHSFVRIAEEKNGGLDDEGLNIRGAAFFFEGNDDAAMKNFQEASSRNSRNPLPNLNLGLLKQKRGNSIEALLHFKRAIAADSSNVLGYLHAANAAYTNKQYQVAASLLERGIGVAPGNALAVYNLGVVQHYGLRQEAKAKANFKKVIDAEDVSEGLRNLARGMLANVQREET